MITYAAGDVEARSAKARAEGLVLQQSGKDVTRFRCTSARYPGHFYSVTVKLGKVIDGAACSCEAAEKGMQCKHGAAAIKARRDQIVCQAARILAQHGARKRRVK